MQCCIIIYISQDTNDNFLLLNNILNFDEQTTDGENYFDSIQEKEWLDLIDFKEEPTYFDDTNNPVKDSERKIKHNKSKNRIVRGTCLQMHFLFQLSVPGGCLSMLRFENSDCCCPSRMKRKLARKR